MALEFGVLGPLAAWSDGEAFEVTGAKRRGLLAYLLAHAGEPQPLDRIVDALWAGSPSRGAESTVQTYVSQLRKLFARDGLRLVRRAGGYVLDLDANALDASRFEAAVSAASAVDERDRRLELLDEALGLWRGPPLDEFAGQVWADDRARQWTRLYVFAQQLRAGALLERGRHRDALPTLEQLVAEHPLHEPFWAQLIVARYRCGQQADALAAVAEARKVFAMELGIELSRELADLERKVLIQDASLDAPEDADTRGVALVGPLPDGVVTFFLTDVEGSTELWDLHPEPMAKALARHEQIIEDVVRTHEGRLLKSRGEGDATLSVFAKATDALAAAVALQQRLASEPWAGDLCLRTRVALHSGEAQLRSGDYYGGALNRAARIRSLARGNDILVSRATHDLVCDTVAADVELAPFGEHTMKGLRRREAVYLVRRTETRRGDDSESVVRHAMDPVLLSRASLFVGREHELDVLVSEWERARAGEQRIAVIGGEPGIGKTTLAGELARHASASGGAVLIGRCDENSATPYLPFVETLGDEAAWLRGEGPVRDGDPATQRFLLFEQTRAVLEGLASRWPVLLVLDDVHWADAPSLLLLRHLARRASHARILIVCLYRTSELATTPQLVDFLANLTRDVGHRRVTLRGLTAADVATLVESVDAFSDTSVSGFADALADATRGNPFFVGQVLRHVAETLQDGSTTATSWKEFGVSDEVREVIASRLSRLSSDTTELLRVAAVIGDIWDYTVAASASGLDDDAAVAAVEQAEDTQFVTSVDASEPTFAFAHALVRETLYSTLSTPRRQRLHLRVADAMQTRRVPTRASDAPLIARHLCAAGSAAERDVVIAWLIRAGDYASQLFAFEDALRFWWDAAERLREAHDGERDDERIRLLERTGSLAFATGIAPELGVRAVEEALQIAQQHGDRERGARLHSRLGVTYSLPAHGERVDIPRALDHLDAAAFVLAGRTNRSGGYFLVSHASALMRDLRLGEAHEASARALEIAEAIGDQTLWANAAVLHGWCLFEEGQLRAGPALVERAYAAGKESGVFLNQFLAAWNRSNSAIMLDDPATSVAWCVRDLDDPKLLQARGSAEHLIAQAARSLWDMGRMEERRALVMRHKLDDPMPPADLSTWYRERIEAGWQHVQDTGDKWDAGFMMAGFIENAVPDVRHTEPDRCRTVIDWAMTGKARVIEFLTRSRAALAEVRNGNLGDAQAHTERAIELMSDGQDWGNLTGRLDYVEALRYTQLKDEASAADAARRALDAWNDAGFAWRRILANLVLGRLGDASATDRATAILEQCGAHDTLRKFLSDVADADIMRKPSVARP